MHLFNQLLLRVTWTRTTVVLCRECCPELSPPTQTPLLGGKVRAPQQHLNLFLPFSFPPAWAQLARS